MNLSRIFAARKTRPSLRQSFSPETLEGRNLLSTVVAGMAPADVHQDTHLVPMKGSGDGVISLADIAQGIPHVTYTGTGHISHLGRVTISGQHVTFPTNGNILNGDTIPTGTLTITAANGDKLNLSYTGAGTLISTPAQLQQGIVRFNDTFHYTITGGTGRFEGATGSGVILAVDGVPQSPGLEPFAFNLDGVISTVGSGHKGAGG